MEQLNASIGFDRRMYEADIRGSQAYARALDAAGILTDDEAAAIVDGLEQVAEEWRTALEEPDFAADRTARYLWWYQRTPYWDETVGLLPAMRVMAPPELALEPWQHR